MRNLVVGRGLTLAATGVAHRRVRARGCSPACSKTMLNDVRPTDPVVFAATAASVVAVTLLASYLPARSAGQVDPMIVLRDA